MYLFSYLFIYSWMNSLKPQDRTGTDLVHLWDQYWGYKYKVCPEGGAAGTIINSLQLILWRAAVCSGVFNVIHCSRNTILE